jgi:hypothetical protein
MPKNVAAMDDDEVASVPHHRVQRARLTSSVSSIRTHARSARSVRYNVDYDLAWLCFRRSRRRRRSRPPRGPLLPPEDADDLQEQAGALRFPSRVRERDSEQRRRGPVVGV